jgi:threonine/homoserine/homoserine lactone efflux protein
MALTAISVYAPSKTLTSICLVAAVFGLVNFPCIACWTGLGTKIKAWLRDPSSLKRFNYCRATLLVLSLYPIFI